MTAIMENRVRTLIICIILLVSLNFTFAMVMSAERETYGEQDFIYSGKEMDKEWIRIKEESTQWWKDVIEPEIIPEPDIYGEGGSWTLQEAYDIFEGKWGFRYEQAEYFQKQDYWKGLSGGFGDVFVKRSDFSEDQINELESQGMPSIVSFIFLMINIIIGIVLGIIIWSFVYDGLSLIPFVGK